MELVGIAGPQADRPAAAVHLRLLADQALEGHRAAGGAQPHVHAGDRARDGTAARVQVRVKRFDLPEGRTDAW